MKNIRTRFAPSPTGFLHIGGLKMIVFDYLIAKKLGGKMILRIEDTDQKREVEGAVNKLYSIIKWIGLDFDEGPEIGGDFGPYIQSQRLDIYKKHADKLLERGLAYKCFCSSDRLVKMREEQHKKKLPPRYDRACRDLRQEEIDQLMAEGREYVIRQKMPLEGEIVVVDEVRGEIKFRAEDLDDHILIKSNGVPTYQFANVIDDHLMEISHVLRAEEWISSFPKNVLLYEAFGWEIPKFIHASLILNKEGGKLSKRQGDVAVEDYKKNGYLPEALINFVVLLGWHPKDDNEILSLGDMVDKFSIQDMQISSAVFDLGKLDYFNGYYIRQKTTDELYELCLPFLRDYWDSRLDIDKFEKEFIKKAIKTEQERMKKLSEIGEITEFFFLEEIEYDKDLLIWKSMTSEDVKSNLKETYEQLDRIAEANWTDNSIEDAMINHIKAKEAKVGNFLWPMRASLTGRKASPGPFEVAEVLGKEKTLKRIKKAINIL